MPQKGGLDNVQEPIAPEGWVAKEVELVSPPLDLHASAWLVLGAMLRGQESYPLDHSLTSSTLPLARAGWPRQSDAPPGLLPRCYPAL